MAEPRAVLEQATTIAVVGMSTDEGKESHAIPISLREAGYRIIPVHPKAEEMAGEKAYASLQEVPEHVDVVEVFRPAEEAPAIARQAAQIEADALWLQLGIVSDDARRIAEEAGMAYVEDACMGQERIRHGITKSG
jgi:predicted CoA-binding protein